MTEDKDLTPLFEELAADPSFAEAAAQHEAACNADDGDDCWYCQTKDAILSLAHWHDGDDTDFAGSECGDLADAVDLIAACQKAMSFLSAVAFEAASIIHHNEFGDEEDDDGDELEH